MSTPRIAILSLATLLLSGCTTNALVLQPRIRPLDAIPQTQLAPIHIQSFEDKAPPEERGFLEPAKRYQHPPIQVLNDALLIHLRDSHAFERVDRDRPTTDGYVLRGELLEISTDESWFKFALAPSTLEIAATCVTHYRLEDASGNVLLDETLVATGAGATDVTASTGSSTTVWHDGEPIHVNSGGGTTYDSTSGLERSLSDALAQTIEAITNDVLATIAAIEMEHREGRSEPPAVAP